VLTQFSADSMLHSLLKHPSQRGDKEMIKIRFLLAKHPVFHHLSQATLHKLSKVTTIEHHQAGDLVYRMGGPVHRVYFVESGSCESFVYTFEQLKFLKAKLPPPRRDLTPRRGATVPSPKPTARPVPSTDTKSSTNLLHADCTKSVELDRRQAAVADAEAAASNFNMLPSAAPAKLLLYSSRARSMLKLSGLQARCSVMMLRRGAATLDSENWVPMYLSTDDGGLVRAQPRLRRAGPSFMQADSMDAVLATDEHKDVLGALREVHHVEEFSLGEFPMIARIVFAQGDSLTVCFETEATRQAWMPHFKWFRDKEDKVIHTLVAKFRPEAELVAGDMFGTEEMRNPNPIEAQSGVRTQTVRCTSNTQLLTISRMDFLNVLEKSPIFSLQERLTTLKLAALIPPGDHTRLFRAARALIPRAVAPNQIVCRAGMCVDAGSSEIQNPGIPKFKYSKKTYLGESLFRKFGKRSVI